MLRDKRFGLVIGLIIFAASIVLAIVIHPAVNYCSYTGSVLPRGCPKSGSLSAPRLRIGIAIAGLMVGALIVIVTGAWRGHHAQKP